MDVRCERCRAQYVFDDEQVTPQGLTVQCTNCGHVFRVKKKELVVTVPVRPDEITEEPILASAAAQKPVAPAPPTWTIRQAGRSTFTFSELTTLQKWIVERKVTRDDEVSQGDGPWVRLGQLEELASFFDVVEAADRGRRPPPAPRSTAPYQAPPFPPPSFAAPPPPAPPAAAPPAPAPRRPPSPPPSPTGELGADELAAVGRRPGPARIAVAALLLAAAGAAAWAFLPGLASRPPPEPVAVAAPPPAPAPAPAPQAVAVPITIEVKGAEAPSGPAPAPQAEPAKPAAEAAPAKVAGPKALLAQAQKLREKGEPARALDLFGKVISADPENVEALTGRGLCYLDLGQYHTALASFQAALAADPEQPDALMGLAETYRSQGKTAEAVAQYERYLALHPDGEEAAVARNAISQLKEP